MLNLKLKTQFTNYLFIKIKIMKKFLLLTIIVLLSSCTPMFDTETNSICPCTVVGIEKITFGKYKAYKVTFKDDDLGNPSYFSFKTKHLYNIGDTIK